MAFQPDPNLFACKNIFIFFFEALKKRAKQSAQVSF